MRSTVVGLVLAFFLTACAPTNRAGCPPANKWPEYLNRLYRTQSNIIVERVRNVPTFTRLLNEQPPFTYYLPPSEILYVGVSHWNRGMIVFIYDGCVEGKFATDYERFKAMNEYEDEQS